MSTKGAHLGQRGAASRVVNDLLDHALHVAIALREVLRGGEEEATFRGPLKRRKGRRAHRGGELFPEGGGAHTVFRKRAAPFRWCVWDLKMPPGPLRWVRRTRPMAEERRKREGNRGESRWTSRIELQAFLAVF